MPGGPLAGKNGRNKRIKCILNTKKRGEKRWKTEFTLTNRRWKALLRPT